MMKKLIIYKKYLIIILNKTTFYSNNKIVYNKYAINAKMNSLILVIQFEKYALNAKKIKKLIIFVIKIKIGIVLIAVLLKFKDIFAQISISLNFLNFWIILTIYVVFVIWNLRIHSLTFLFVKIVNFIYVVVV